MMIDTRAVGQELQEQLVGAARRGQARARQAQERARQAQAQVRKSQETVTEMVRSLSQNAEALRPTVNIPSLPRPAELRASAEEVAGQLRSTRRKVSGQVSEAAQKFAAERLPDQVTQTVGPLLIQGATLVRERAQRLPEEVSHAAGHRAQQIGEAAQKFAAERLPEQVTQTAGPLLAQGAHRVGQAAEVFRAVLPAMPGLSGRPGAAGPTHVEPTLAAAVKPAETEAAGSTQTATRVEGPGSETAPAAGATGRAVRRTTPRKSPAATSPTAGQSEDAKPRRATTPKTSTPKTSTPKATKARTSKAKSDTGPADGAQAEASPAKPARASSSKTSAAKASGTKSSPAKASTAKSTPPAGADGEKPTDSK
jgi:trimeric autotransporter adhesin